MSPSLKLQIESFGITFVSAFLVALGASVQNISLTSISWNIVLGLVIAAVGVAARTVYNTFVTSSLGNQLKTGSIVPHV